MMFFIRFELLFKICRIEMKHLTHKIVVTLYFSLILSFSVNAQDSIIKRDGSELNVKITEISETELKYQKSGLMFFLA